VLKKLEAIGQLDNTSSPSHSNGAENITFPDGGSRPSRREADHLGGRHARSVVVVGRDISSRARSKNPNVLGAPTGLPTLVDHPGGPIGDALKKQIEAGAVPGHRQDHTGMVVDQLDYLEGKSESRRVMSSSTTPAQSLRLCGIRTGKMYYTMVGTSPGRRDGGVPELCLDHGCQHQARSLSSRLPFGRHKIHCWRSAARSAPQAPPIIYDWNMLPIGQLLWTKELMSYKQFRRLQARRPTTWMEFSRKWKASSSASHAGQ